MIARNSAAACTFFSASFVVSDAASSLSPAGASPWGVAIVFGFKVCGCVCVLLLQDLLQSCSRGGGGEWRTCAMRDDEPRPVWMSLPITH